MQRLTHQHIMQCNWRLLESIPGEVLTAGQNAYQPDAQSGRK